MVIPTIIHVKGVPLEKLITGIDRIEGVVRDVKIDDKSGRMIAFRLFPKLTVLENQLAIWTWAEILLSCHERGPVYRITITPNDLQAGLENPDTRDFLGAALDGISTYTSQMKSIGKLTKEIIRAVQILGGVAEIADSSSPGDRCPHCGSIHVYGKDDYIDGNTVRCKNCSSVFEILMEFASSQSEMLTLSRIRCPYCKATYTYKQSHLISENSVRCQNCNEALMIEVG
ncbi:MAG: hypothetical protein ACFFEF_14470 [Candidatus Thorarchaeota archaeon]